jgi:hypothetical protein
LEEYTAARALRLPSGPSRWSLPRRWSSQTNREVMDGSRGTKKDGLAPTDTGPGITEGGWGTLDEGLAITDEGPEVMVDGPGTMEGPEIMDTTTATPSPTCC